MATNNTINANSTSPLAVAGGGTGANTLTIHGLLKGDAAGAVSALPAATDGQLPIGSTGADPVLATLTAGPGITITNGPGSITIDTAMVSSKRFKERITDMADRSDRVMQLRPVNFSYKQDASHVMQWGLIAEEVAEIMPELVTYDVLGEPYTVRYNDLPAILLNEMQKMAARIKQLEEKCSSKE